VESQEGGVGKEGVDGSVRVVGGEMMGGKVGGIVKTVTTTFDR
jgi:hypothetical protein